MKQNKIALKTLAMKAKVANYIRKTFYKREFEDLKLGERDQILKAIYDLNREMHESLWDYRLKREYKAHLLERRLAAPQTKTMLKKLSGKTKKNLVIPK